MKSTSDFIITAEEGEEYVHSDPSIEKHARLLLMKFVGTPFEEVLAMLDELAAARPREA